VCVSRGRRDVRIDHDEQVELLHCFVDAFAVRERSHGITCQHEESPDGFVAWGRDLFGQGGAGKFAFYFGAPRGSSGPTPKLKAAAARFRRCEVLRRRTVEHDSAWPIEVAGQHVEYVGRPASEGAELDGVCAHTAVDRGGWSRSQFASDPPSRIGVDTAWSSNRLGRIRARGLADFVDPTHMVLKATDLDEVLIEQRVD